MFTIQEWLDVFWGVSHGCFHLHLVHTHDEVACNNTVSFAYILWLCVVYYLPISLQ